MLKNGEWEGIERRAAERIEDRSILLVSGRDSVGRLFEETTRIHNVSPDGIAFLLRAKVREEDLLNLYIYGQEEEKVSPVPSFFVQVKVLRVTGPEDEDGNHLVAGKYVEDVVSLKRLHDIEAMAKKLESAIALDEESRRFPH